MLFRELISFLLRGKSLTVAVHYASYYEEDELLSERESVIQNANNFYFPHYKHRAYDKVIHNTRELKFRH